MKKSAWMVVALAATACNPTNLDLRSGPVEDEELARAEKLLGAQVRDLFGPEARVRALYGPAERQVVAVGMSQLPEASDALPAVALGAFDAASGTLTLLDPEPRFREARLFADAAAVVSADGELQLRRDGQVQTLAMDVKGDLAPTSDGQALALTLYGAEGAEEETAVAVVDLAGNLTVLADSEALDDRPALSPDGSTVVFVSGRTGIASLFRTSMAGEAAVQLTNQQIEVDVERDEDPEGFVPPPVSAARIEWVDADVVRYDAGGGDWWRVDVRTGAASREGGAL